MKLSSKKVFSNLQMFYEQHIRFEERCIFSLLTIIFVLAAIFASVNDLSTHYLGNKYLPSHSLWLLPYFLCSTALGLYYRHKNVRIGNFIKGSVISLICLIACGTTASSIQFTPFSTIDPTLVNIDNQWLHLDTPKIVDWTFSHPFFAHLLNDCYLFLQAEVIIVFFTLAALKSDRRFNQYVTTVLISWIIGTLIYYFWPTIGPAAMFNNPHFAISQYNTILKFNQIHHYLTVTTMDGGMIVFPSFHVIWAALIIYAFYGCRYWIFAPVVIINLLIIASTVLLGRHYLTDVIGGLVIVASSIYLNRYLNQLSLLHYSQFRRALSS